MALRFKEGERRSFRVDSWRLKDPNFDEGRRERSRALLRSLKKSIFMYRSHILPTQDGMNYHTKNKSFRKKSWVYIIKPEVDPFSSSDPELIVS